MPRGIPTSGRRRPGGGRKPRAEAPAASVTVRLSPAELRAVDARAARDGVTRSEAVRRMVGDAARTPATAREPDDVAEGSAP